MVTVAVRRVNLDRSKESLLDYIDAKKYFLLPNTAGCYNRGRGHPRSAPGTRSWPLRLGQARSDRRPGPTLYPDVQATLASYARAGEEGFTVLPYTSDDIVFCEATD